MMLQNTRVVPFPGTPKVLGSTAQMPLTMPMRRLLVVAARWLDDGAGPGMTVAGSEGSRLNYHQWLRTQPIMPM